MKRVLLALFLVSATGCGTYSSMNVHEIQAYNKARVFGRPVFIEDVDVLHPNSAGGVSVSFIWHNLSSTVVKYAYMTMVPYNAVGDQVVSEIGGEGRKSVRITGPVEPGAKDSGLWENAWYNHTIRCAELVEMRIEYMDGSVLVLEKPELDEMIYSADGIANSCEYESN